VIEKTEVGYIQILSPRPIFQELSQIALRIFHNALAIMLLTALAHTRWAWGLLGWNVLAAFLVGTASNGIAMYFASLRSADDSIRLLFANSSNQEIEEIPHRELRACLPEKLESFLRFPKTFHYQRLRQGAGLSEIPNEALLRVFVRRFAGMPFDHLLKAYSSGVGSSMVFLLDDPRRDTSAFSKFKFFHELAHVTKHGAAVFAKRYWIVLVAIASLSIGIHVGKMTTQTLLGGLLIIGSAVETFITFELECEYKADALALTMITPAERSRVLDLCRKDWSRQIQPGGDVQERSRGFVFNYRLARLSANVKSLAKQERLVFGFHWNNGNWYNWAAMFVGSILLGMGIRPLTRFEALIVSGISIFAVTVPGAWLHHILSGAERGLDRAVYDYSAKAPEQRVSLEQLFASTGARKQHLKTKH